MVPLLGRILRWLLLLFAGLALFSAATIAYLGFTASGNQWLANRVASAVSTPDMQVRLEGAHGLLAGRFHLDRATLADTKGQFAELQSVDISWSPLDLLSGRFHAGQVRASRISLARLPVKTIDSQPSDTSFSLPVEVKIDSLSLPVIALGKALVNKDTIIGLSGSAEAISDRIALDLTAAERDRLNATAKAKLAYAVNGRTLSVDSVISEPQGGLLARLLALPGEPPVDIAVKGDGPLDEWHGAIHGRVAGRDVLQLTGAHSLDGETHRVTLAGGGELSELMPQAFRSLFAGQTAIDIDARFAATGLVDIRSGSIVNDSFTLTAKGELDPQGLARLKADLLPAHDVLHVTLPLASGPVTADIGKASLGLNGPFTNAAIDLSASLARLSTPDLKAGAVTLAAQSNNFNLASTTGRLSYQIAAATLDLNNPELAKVVQAPLTLNGNVDVGTETVTLAQSDIASAKVNGTLSGRFDRVSNSAAASFNLSLAPQGLLPPAIEAKVKGRLGLSGQVAAALPGSLSAQNLKLTSNLVTVVGSAAMNDGQVKASFSGDVGNVGDLAPAATGNLHFSVVASGPAQAPQVVAQASSPELRLNRLAIADAAVRFATVIDPNKPGGHLTASATYRGQKVTAEADALYADSRVSIPALKAAIGANTAQGAVALDARFLPSGAIDLDLADISSLAALADQTASGALKARVDLAPRDGRIAGRLTAEGQRLNTSGIEISGARLDLDIADVLARQVKGRLSADSLAAGASRIDALALDLALNGGNIDFQAAGQLDAQPLAAKGKIVQEDKELRLSLASFSAAPRHVSVTLAQPAEITIADGHVHLDNLTVAADKGTLVVNGDAGQMLDLTAEITDLPLALANVFVPGLEAAGALSAKATINGSAALPVVQFDATTSGLATAQTRKAGLPAMALAANGRFADRTLTVTVSGALRDQPARIDATVRLDGAAVSVPALTADIGASHFSGALAIDKLAHPSGRIAFDVPDAQALAAVFGRKAEGAVKGTMDISSDAGKTSAVVAATGTIRNQAIKATVEASLASGALALPRIDLAIGRNTVAGAMTLDSQLLPSGRIGFNLPDVGLLAAMAGQKAEGSLKGTADIQSASGRIEARLVADGTLLGQAIAVNSTIVSDQGRISLPVLDATVGANRLKGAISLDGNFMPAGRIDFDLPDLASLAAMAGQKAEGALKGSAVLQSTGRRIEASVTATGAVRQQAIGMAGHVVAENGAISLPSVKIDIGANTLSGALTFDKASLPTGQLQFDFPDIGLLAAMAGQQAEGGLKGRVVLASVDGRMSGRADAEGAEIRASGLTVAKPVIALAFDDLAAGRLTGQVKADRIKAGASDLDRPTLDFEKNADGSTHFRLTGGLDAAPLAMEGQLVPGDLGLKLTLSTFEATPRKVPLRLAAPTDILIGQGAARLSNLVIAVGKGSIRIDGTAGSLLDLTAEVKDLPISLANAIVPDLAAEGALSAHVKITGQASMPQVTFDATAQDLATSQTRAAGLPQIDVTTKGHFADNGLTVAVDSRLGAQPLHASADVALNGGTITIAPLKAEIGKSVFSGTLALDAARQPSGKLAFDIPDAQALASIVGRKAEGAVRGTADIRSAGGAIAIQVDADGLVRKQAIKAKADVALDKGALSLPALDLTVGTNHLDGALTLGPDLLPSGALTFDFPDLALLAAIGGQKAEGALKGTAKITSESGKTDARIAATGLIRKQAIAIAIAAVRQNGSIALPSLSLAIGKNRLDGALSLDAGYLPTGKLTFDLPDIGLIAALGGQTATGSIRGSADIASTDGKLGGTVTARGERITALGVEIVKPSVDLKIVDLAAAQVSGKVTADRLTSGSNSLARLALNFNRSGAQTAFDLNGQYDGAPLVAKGAVADEADGMAVSIDTFSAAPRKIVVRLQKPTTIRIKDGAVSLSSLQISAGKGTIAVTGAAGGKLDLTAKITALPASLANAFASGLDAAGTISATVTAKGDPAAPVVAFDVDWRNAALAQTKSAGLTDFSVTAKGQMANNVVTLNAAARGASGLSLTAGGTVGIAGRRAINLKVNGRLPFAALGPLLARQGIDLKGDADFDLTVTGAATSPAVSGRISTSGATLTVIRQNLTIKSLAASVTLDGRQARIASLTGNLSGGGTVSASGTIGIAPNSGFPADLRIALKNAVYTDGKVVAAKLSGDLTVTGSLVASPTLGGKITLRRADITIPQKLPGTLAQLDIKHRHAPRDVLVQAERIRENRPGTRTGTDTGGLSLDLTIVAQRQIFVRGRGLDAELGGQVKIAGTSAVPNVTGGFAMRRGRLSIVGRRLDFTDGKISFAGNLTPALDFTATSTVESTTISVIIAGLANDPSVSFSSSPSLPQDEVLALLIFGRNSAQLSPVQIAQLADAVSTLAGGTSNSLFNRLRQGLGVDDLDVGTDENGKSNVSVGKYLNKRTYLQLQQGVDTNTSKAVINLDVGKGVKLRGEAGSDGSTGGGVFFEKEY